MQKKKVLNNRIFFIIVSQGVGTMGHGDEYLRLINSPVLLLTTEKIPVITDLVVSIGFELDLTKFERFHFELWSPEEKKISETDLTQRLEKSMGEHNEEESVIGILAEECNQTGKFETAGEYRVKIYYNNEKIGETSFFIDLTENDEDE